VKVEPDGGGTRGKRGKRKTKRAAKQVAPRSEASAPGMAEALRTWRLGEAKRRKVPAFRIFSDRVLVAIAAARPASTEALVRISGVGPKLVERSGHALVALCAGERRGTHRGERWPPHALLTARPELGIRPDVVRRTQAVRSPRNPPDFRPTSNQIWSQPKSWFSCSSLWSTTSRFAGAGQRRTPTSAWGLGTEGEERSCGYEGFKSRISEG